MKVGSVLQELHRGEVALYYELLQLSQRYAAEHEVHHVARDLSQWSREHVAHIAGVADTYGQDLAAEISDPRASKHAQHMSGSESVGVNNPSGLPLLWDLQSVYMASGGVSVQWVMLSQAAQALNKPDLLATVETCHPGTVRQMGWAKAQIKQLSAQILLS